MKIGPKTIQLDLLKRLIGPFLFVFLTIMFLLLMQFLMLYIDKIVGKGLPLSVILELILSNLAYMVVIAFPMAVLVSTLMVYGAFSESNEFTVIKASGIHPMKMILPTAYLGFTLFLGMVIFSNYILPEANYRARALFLDIRMKKPGFDLKEGVFYDGIDGYTFLVNQKPSESDSLFGISVFQEARDGKSEALIKAKRGFLESIQGAQALKLSLIDGEMFRTIKSKVDASKTIEKTGFATYSISFDLSKLEFSRSNPESRGRNDRTMNAEAMLEVYSKLDEEISNDISTAFSQNKTFDLRFEKKEKDTTLVLTSRMAINLSNPTTISTPKKKTSFSALNYLDSFEEQRELVRNSIRGIRARSVNYDGVVNTLKWKKERQSKYLVEVHKKVAIPFGCFLFVFIGGPIGLLTRKGNLGVATIISALIFTVYWIGLIQGEKLADRLFVSPLVGMWGINLFYTVIAILLMTKVIREKVFR